MNRIMKGFLTVLLLGSVTGAARAADTQSLGLTAQVTGVCKFNSGQTPLIDFGTLDPSSGATASGSASATFRCTKGSSFTVTAGNGLHFATTRNLLNTANTDTIAYTLPLTGATGSGLGFSTGNDLTVTANGSIAGTAYQDVSAGTYEDTVVLSISP